MDKTYKSVWEEAETLLKSKNIPEAKLDAWYLFEHVISIGKVEYYLNQDKRIESDQYEKYMNMVKLRSNHIPLQHIIGTQEFMGLEFCVDENVLIPRQDTECLVEEVMKVVDKKSVLDVCTGSGCIIISLGKLCSLGRAVALDISKKALSIASINAKRLNANVEFIESNLFQNVMGRFDVIVSNPPYIPTKEIEKLMEEVKNHEPLLALDGKEDGLYFYKEIVRQAFNYLNPGGYLFFEIGYDQGEDVAKLMDEHGFIEVTVKQDMAGLDRIVSGRIKK